MGRLIDADKVIEHLEEVKKESASLVDIAHIIGFQSLINSQPTAYNPDKVVERLQDVACRIDTHRIDDTNALSAIDIIDEDDLIEIVKSGGIDT